ncbi:hypothetical protein [Rubrivirga sp.]|uniref:hypothetical protein n=1 Tax=Rubrivirga sp. TaxID=1885344 RepID=UPI003C755433
MTSPADAMYRTLLLLPLLLTACSNSGSLSDAEVQDARFASGCVDIQPLDWRDGGGFLRTGLSTTLRAWECRHWIGTGDDARFTAADYSVFRLADISMTTITQSSDEINAFVTLYDSLGNIIATDGDNGAGQDATVTRLLEAGSYIVAASSADGSEGRYTLDIRTAR